jgi:hypothetical protein
MYLHQRVLLIIQLVLTAVLGLLQLADKSMVEQGVVTPRNVLIAFVVGWKVPAAVFCIVAIAALSSWDKFFEPRRQKREFRKRIMLTMMEELFVNNPDGLVRITMFKDAAWPRCRWFRLHELYLATRKWESAPKRSGKYIFVRERLGTEFAQSKTYFDRSPATRRNVQGVAGFVRQTLKTKVVHRLPEISRINLETLETSGTIPEKEAVETYMKRGLVDMATLRRINVKSRHLCGTILLDKAGDPRGVLVIDSVAAESPFNDLTIQKVETYSKLFITAI